MLRSWGLAIVVLVSAAPASAEPVRPRAAYTLEVLGISGNEETSRAAVLRLVEVGVDAPVAVGAVHVAVLGIHGDRPTAALGDLHGVSNLEAPGDVRIYEAWWQLPIGELLSLRAGVLAVDQELVIAEAAQLFVQSTFGIPAPITHTLGGPVYPVGAPGARLEVRADSVALRAAIYDGTPHDWHGLPRGPIDDVLGFVEATWSAASIGGWAHTTHPGGVYAMVDHERGRLAGFARAVYSPGGTPTSYLDAGVSGLAWPARPRDRVGVAVAASFGDVRETTVEATYRAVLSRRLAVQPDFQVVVRADDPFLVLGIRAAISLDP